MPGNDFTGLLVLLIKAWGVTTQTYFFVGIGFCRYRFSLALRD